MSPKISIGLPVYNGEKYIATAIKSILSQSFTDFELIISDNGSEDLTEEIIRQYISQDNRIKYFRHKKNKGSNYNFDFVRQKAVGKYFMWAAHDDTWSTDHLEICNFILNSNNDIGFVFPYFELKSIKLGVAKKMDCELFDFITSNDRRSRVLNFLNLHHSTHKCNLVYSLFRKSLIDRVSEKQGIENDGVLAALILAESKGAIPEKITFSKRYKYYWPGLFMRIISILHKLRRGRKKDAAAKMLVQETASILSRLFPEYESEVNDIFIDYHQKLNSKYTRIVNKVF